MDEKKTMSCTYESNKDCELGEYLKDCCECVKIFVDNLVVACDEIVDTLESAPVYPSNRINC